MFHSRNFIAHSGRIKKRSGGDEHTYRSELQRHFVQALPMVDGEIAGDVATYCVQTRENSDELVQFMADIVDLMHQQYDDHADPFTAGDWQYLSEWVNANAGDMEMDLVQYIMERVVSHHVL